MYKMALEFDRKDRAVIHPALLAVDTGKKVTKLVVVKQFTDDHLPCIEAKITVGGVVYNIGDWWLGYQRVAQWYRAESNKDCREKLVKRLLRMAKMDAKEHNANLADIEKEEAKGKS